MDYTRMTQNGHFEGWISLDGERWEMAAGTCGTRDRSWGVRPIGARDEQPMPGAPIPSFFWQWTPVNLPTRSLFYHLNAHADGTGGNNKDLKAVLFQFCHLLAERLYPAEQKGPIRARNGMRPDFDDNAPGVRLQKLHESP